MTDVVIFEDARMVDDNLLVGMVSPNRSSSRIIEEKDGTGKNSLTHSQRCGHRIGGRPAQTILVKNWG